MSFFLSSFFSFFLPSFLPFFVSLPPHVSCLLICRLSFGKDITCRTGKYTGQKIPTARLKVTVRYGMNTVKDVLSSFHYAEDPKVLDFYPRTSFVW